MRMLLIPCAAVTGLLLFFVVATLLVSSVAGWLIPLIVADRLVWLGLAGIVIAGISTLLGCCPRGRCSIPED